MFKAEFCQAFNHDIYFRVIGSLHFAGFAPQSLNS